MRFKHQRIAAVGLALLFILSLAPVVPAASQVPPKPARFDYVFDYAGLLSQEDKATISSLGRELDAKTGAQIAVVTVDSLGEVPIKDYANTLFRSWELGNKAKNNGVLLLVNKENMLTGKPGRVRIEVGYGLEGAIPDGKAGRILDDYVLSRWDQGKYSEGILQGYLAVAAEVAREHNVTLEGSSAPVPLAPGESNGDRLGSAPFLGLVIAIIVLGIFLLTARKRRRGGRGGDDSFGGGWGGGGGFGGGSSGGGGADR